MSGYGKAPMVPSVAERIISDAVRAAEMMASFTEQVRIGPGKRTIDTIMKRARQTVL